MNKKPPQLPGYAGEDNVTGLWWAKRLKDPNSQKDKTQVRDEVKPSVYNGWKSKGLKR